MPALRLYYEKGENHQGVSHQGTAMKRRADPSHRFSTRTGTLRLPSTLSYALCLADHTRAGVADPKDSPFARNANENVPSYFSFSKREITFREAYSTSDPGRKS